MHIAKLGDRVRIQYSRVPTNGAGTDKPRAPRTLEFTVGSAKLLASVSLGVVGMAPGDRKRLSLQPNEAYGVLQPGLVQEIPRQRFPKHLVLRVGKKLTATERVSRRRRRVRVVEIRPGAVVVDGNHPLAGQVIELEIGLITLDSSSNANKSMPQFDVGGES